MVSKRTGKPAEVADYDSDESRIVSGTEVSAKTSSKRRVQEQPSPRTAKAERSSRIVAPSAPAGDLRYSSTPAAGESRAVATPAATKSITKTTQSTASGSPIKTTNKPVIHRADSARSTTRSATISGSASTHSGCTDQNCRKPGCESGRNIERRYTLSNQTSMPPPQYTYQPAYDYAAMPPPSAMPRPRAESVNRPRPQSMYATAQAMPQAAPSAYYPYPQGAYAPQHSLYGTTPPAQAPMYAPQAHSGTVMPPSPSSPVVTTYPGFPGQTTKYSARTGNPAVPGLATSIAMPPPPSYNVPAESARQNRRSVQMEDYRGRADDSTSSESESSEDDRRYERRRDSDRRYETRRIDNGPSRSKSRRRQSRDVVVEDPRRPSAKKSYTMSVVPTRRPSHRGSSTRPDLAYRTLSDPHDNYHSSSENYNSDRAVVERRSIGRPDPSLAKHARRSSIASSYDTPPTSLSSDTRYEAIIEDRNGRHKVYLTRDEVASLAEQRERQAQQDREEEQRVKRERIEEYQKTQSAGYERQNLTADNIKQASRKSMSHVSGRSQKSGASGSKVSRSGGLRIESNGTVLYLEDGIREIALGADDEGGTRVVINSGTGRENSYHGSKSSSSRVGRSRTSRHEVIREEDQYEKAL
ncbi:hypothetical protein Slin15195_G054810 [Septoria linicola]|uniref:Uncharacterized protein n=1 Tax=Septoria linicola TaxID=215465 RepID=A0A9Q9AMG1_9PEZI|nr:hypothetical protein Slin14017_G070670 [Septoria linicola]USW52162.1 hypothetical protein Slin15195_G054810 [Septoria linicola]